MITVNRKPVEFKYFNDGACFLEYLTPEVKDLNITWLYEYDEEIVHLMYLTKHLRAHASKNQNINLYMPYIVNARQDRVKKEDDVFTLKYFAELINSLHFDEVRVYDPHSVVSEALFDNLVIERPYTEIDAIMNCYPDATVFFPDDGAMKRYKEYVSGHRFGYGVKTRNWETKEIESLQPVINPEDVAGHDIVIVDDICGVGSTICKAARQLKLMGAQNIYVWVSHCENTVLKPNFKEGSLLDIPDLITKLYTTDSILISEHPKIEVIKYF